MQTPRLGSYAGLAVAVAVAALLQAAIIARTPTISADGIIFIGIARDLPQGVAQTFRAHDQHPGYPAMVLAVTRIVQGLGYEGDPQSWMIGSLAVNFVCGLLCVLLVWLFARDLFDTQVANYAALIFALLPVPRGNASDAQSDTPHLCCYMLAVWLASAAISRGRWLLLAGAGLASGLAYWIRPEGLEVVVVALPCLLWQALRQRWSWGHASAACAALVGAVVIVAAPYPILAGKITSKQLPFAKTQPTTTFIDQLAEAPVPTAVAAATSTDLPQSPTPTAHVEAHAVAVAAAQPATEPPRHYTATLALNLAAGAVAAFLNSIFQGLKFIFIPFYLIGHIELVRRRPGWLRVGFVALLAITHIAILLGVFVLSGYIAHRHVLPLVALAMPFVALGVIYVGRGLARLPRVQAVYAMPATLVACCLLVLPYTLRIVNREFVPVIEATEWVKAQTAADSGVISNSPYVEFYGKLPVAMLGPQAPNLETALAKAAPDARYEFVVLHVGAHDYHPEWIEQLSAHYQQVQLFPDPYCGSRPKKVLVFRSKDAHARRDRHDSRS